MVLHIAPLVEQGLFIRLDKGKLTAARWHNLDLATGERVIQAVFKRRPARQEPMLIRDTVGIGKGKQSPPCRCDRRIACRIRSGLRHVQ